MTSKILITVDNVTNLEDYRKVGITTFLFPLKDFCVGYNTYTIEEINKIEVSNKYILINRVLDCSSTDKLKNILPVLVKSIKGIIYEDISVYMLIKELNLDTELIFFQNHFQTNLESVNFWLSKVDSLFLSNELTKEEISYITSNVKKDICLHLYGYNQAMYSRRHLLKNWCEAFNLEHKNETTITDKATKVKFHAKENEYGTVMYSGNIYNGSILLNEPNIKYFYVNPTMIEHSQVMSFLTNLETHSNSNEDNGFLSKETIYKLKEVPR